MHKRTSRSSRHYLPPPVGCRMHCAIKAQPDGPDIHRCPSVHVENTKIISCIGVPSFQRSQILTFKYLLIAPQEMGGRYSTRASFIVLGSRDTRSTSLLRLIYNSRVTMIFCYHHNHCHRKRKRFPLGSRFWGRGYQLAWLHLSQVPPTLPVGPTISPSQVEHPNHSWAEAGFEGFHCCLGPL